MKPSDDEAKLAALIQALIKGEESGAPKPFDFDAFIARKHAEGGLSPIAGSLKDS